MRALLLAGGLGSRLQPLTNFLPKCLVPIHGRPLLDYWLESLVSGGITEILINTHYKASLVNEYIKKSNWTQYITIVYEESLLGTGGTILKNNNFFQNEAFFIAHADNLTVFDVSEFIQCHTNRPAGTVITMMVFETDDPKSCGIVGCDKNGIVNEFYEKVSSPPGNLANGAVYILEFSIIDLLKKIGRSEIDFSTEIIPILMGQINIYNNLHYHRDIGTITSWKEAHKDFPISSVTSENTQLWATIYESDNDELSRKFKEILLDF